MARKMSDQEILSILKKIVGLQQDILSKIEWEFYNSQNKPTDEIIEEMKVAKKQIEEELLNLRYKYWT